MLRLLLFAQVLWCSWCSVHGQGAGKLLIPLKSLEVRGEFFDSFGEVVIRQFWTNDRNESVTSKYKFALDSSAAVSGFKMKIGDKSWTGVVKAKETARAEFAEAVFSGVKSSLFEKISDTEYQIEIGPISPSESAEVEFHYLAHAAINPDGSYRFVLPTNIAPKYLGSSPPSNRADEEYRNIIASTPYSSKPAYLFDVDLTWHTDSALVGVSSPTNAISTEILSATAARVRCLTAPDHGDFSLVVETKATTGAYSYQNSNGTTYLYVHGQIPVEAVPPTVSPKKITIVLDRSGSMYGAKIGEAKAAVDRFLSLVPANPSTLLNIVSFGSHFNALYSNSVPATASNIATLRARLQTFDADYGGTELLSCLQSVVSGGTLPSGTSAASISEPSNMEHVVLLLTDGQVGNPNTITDMLSDQLAKQKFRVMTIGIGRDADRKLVQQIADTTHGLSRVLVDEADLTRALTDVLSYIDKQYYTNMRVLDYEVSQVASVLYPAHPVDMFLRLSPQQYQEVVSTGLTITAVNPIQGNTKVWHLPVSMVIPSGRVLEKLYADHAISELSKQIDNLDRWGDASRRAELTDSIVELSVQHGIMNQHTSYLVVSDQQVSPEELAEVRQVEVPQYSDFSSASSGMISIATGAAHSGNSGSFSIGTAFSSIGTLSATSGSSSGSVQIASAVATGLRDNSGHILLTSGSTDSGVMDRVSIRSGNAGTSAGGGLSFGSGDSLSDSSFGDSGASIGTGSCPGSRCGVAYLITGTSSVSGVDRTVTAGSSGNGVGDGLLRGAATEAAEKGDLSIQAASLEPDRSHTVMHASAEVENGGVDLLGDSSGDSVLAAGGIVTTGGVRSCTEHHCDTGVIVLTTGAIRGDVGRITINTGSVIHAGTGSDGPAYHEIVSTSSTCSVEAGFDLPSCSGHGDAAEPVEGTELIGMSISPNPAAVSSIWDGLSDTGRYPAQPASGGDGLTTDTYVDGGVQITAGSGCSAIAGASVPITAGNGASADAGASVSITACCGAVASAGTNGAANAAAGVEITAGRGSAAAPLVTADSVADMHESRNSAARGGGASDVSAANAGQPLLHTSPADSQLPSGIIFFNTGTASGRGGVGWNLGMWLLGRDSALNHCGVPHSDEADAACAEHRMRKSGVNVRSAAGAVPSVVDYDVSAGSCDASACGASGASGASGAIHINGADEQNRKKSIFVSAGDSGADSDSGSGSLSVDDGQPSTASTIVASYFDQVRDGPTSGKVDISTGIASTRDHDYLDVVAAGSSESSMPGSVSVTSEVQPAVAVIAPISDPSIGHDSTLFAESGPGRGVIRTAPARAGAEGHRNYGGMLGIEPALRAVLEVYNPQPHAGSVGLVTGSVCDDRATTHSGIAEPCVRHETAAGTAYPGSSDPINSLCLKPALPIHPVHQHEDGSLHYDDTSHRLLRYNSLELYEKHARAVDLIPELYFQAAALSVLDALPLDQPCESHELLRAYVVARASAEVIAAVSTMLPY